MRLCLVSLDQVWLDKVANFERCRNFVSKASHSFCDVIVFPEMTLTGYSMNSHEISEPIQTSDTLSWFADLSFQYNINIVFGAVLSEKSSPLPFNTMCLASPNCSSKIIYRKIHPFSYSGEDLCFSAGSNLEVFHIEGTRILPSICYDLRFPELFSLASSFTDMSLVIANWPKSRIGHWFTLLQARAIENQCFLVGVNRVGSDGNGLSYDKSSLIVSPTGDVLSPELTSHEFDIYDINIDDVLNYRSQFPTLKDRKPFLYRVISQSF